MARVALCAVGLVLAAPTARAWHGPLAPADQTGLFQIIANAASESDSKESDEEPKVDVGYASEDFKEGMLVEAQLPNGTWAAGALGLRTGDAWDVRVPGEEEPQSVPAKLLRRRLNEGESDWLVVEKHKGLLAKSGITYRRSKNLTDLNVKHHYAPFNSLVVGTDDVDGWLKVSQGYLPMRLHGVQVLAKRDRKGTVALTKELRDWYLGAEEARRKVALAKAALEPVPPQIFSVNEEVLYKSLDGKWRPAQVKTSAITSYGVLVQPGGGEYLVPRADPADLKKAGPPKHTPIPGEYPVCQKGGGCIDLILRLGPDVEHKTHAALGMPIHFLMKGTCTVLHEPRNCQTRLALWHRGRALSPSWRTFESGLTNGTVVDVRLAPETVTPLWEVPE